MAQPQHLRFCVLESYYARPYPAPATQPGIQVPTHSRAAGCPSLIYEKTQNSRIYCSAKIADLFSIRFSPPLRENLKSRYFAPIRLMAGASYAINRDVADIPTTRRRAYAVKPSASPQLNSGWRTGELYRLPEMVQPTSAVLMFETV